MLGRGNELFLKLLVQNGSSIQTSTSLEVSHMTEQLKLNRLEYEIYLNKGKIVPVFSYLTNLALCHEDI
jgi:hypothetical protein